MALSKNQIIAIAVVVIIIIAAAAVSVVALGDDDDDNKKTSLGEGRVLVFGNADNDDYLDEEDVSTIENIIKDGTWDSTKYPYADANNDGKVDQSDVTYLRQILNGESTRMYYIGNDGETYYFNYPLADKKIAVSSEYGLMLCEVLGVYDQITAGSSRVLGYSEDRYPGCTKLTNLGNYREVATFTENILDAHCQVALGQLSKDLYDSLHAASGVLADHIYLSASAATSAKGVDVIAEIMTLGIMFDKGDAARTYAAYYDNLNSYIENGTKNLKTYTDIIAYNTNNATTTSIDTMGSTDGVMFGDVWTINHLPVTDIADHSGNGFYSTEIENIIDKNPDIIFISMWGSLTVDTTPAEAQAAFEEKAAYFKETGAYKNGMIFGVNYETIGTYIGISGLALLASYIWPDSFSEDEGWNMLQNAYDQFTVYDGDVKQAGGLQVFKMSS